MKKNRTRYFTRSRVISPLMILFIAGLTCVFCSRLAMGEYCFSLGNCEEYIKSVVVGSIVNTGTGCHRYGDYTEMSTTMEKGLDYVITVTNAIDYYEKDECGVWVDWNRDEDFEDANERVVTEGDGHIFTGTIVPPGDALLGDTRMRVRITYTGLGEEVVPCGISTYGEVEDYTITVIEAVTGRVRGVVFNDANGNGIYDANEQGLAGWKIYIDANENGVWDEDEPNETSDSDGGYGFIDLLPGDYVVAEVNQNNWYQTYPVGNGSHLVSITAGDIVENIDFGNVSTICGSRWDGLDGDDDVDFEDVAILCEQWLLERLSADISPYCPDGIVDFSDWAIFAGAWQSNSSSPNWNGRCDIGGENGNGLIDWNDAEAFFDQWLKAGAYSADISPLPDGDGVVDGFDFAALAQNWLEEF